ncbi:hypothetical protein SS50377_20983 [Spironucleus salmonicida]|uniref:Uncharacterized protein n=1 Tax=Spironucleus salmonicida TaxID=348837 RepID=A0A9P8S1U5_9EUKA|nr:hypothetical protein SS50377_20978 [Spironucleus salmonicida]KAH0577629.1 hypothetical protein SS50377_20983 [Spironucleus salmonicida]
MLKLLMIATLLEICPRIFGPILFCSYMFIISTDQEHILPSIVLPRTPLRGLITIYYTMVTSQMKPPLRLCMLIITEITRETTIISPQDVIKGFEEVVIIGQNYARQGFQFLQDLENQKSSRCYPYIGSLNRTTVPQSVSE